MEYWKGKAGTPKNGQSGTMDNNGSVPDSIPVTQEEYDVWLASLPVPLPPQKSDIERLVEYAKTQGWI